MTKCPSTQYNEHSDTIVGGVDLGPYCDVKNEGEMADKVMFVLIRSCCGPMVQAIGHYFAKGQVPGATLKKILEETIRAVRNASFTVLGLSSDAGANNLAAFRKLGRNDENHNKIFVDGSSILLFLDPPHLIKRDRNQMISGRGNRCKAVPLEVLYTSLFQKKQPYHSVYLQFIDEAGQPFSSKVDISIVQRIVKKQLLSFREGL